MKISDTFNMSDKIYDNSDSNKIKGRVVITDTRTGKVYERHNTVVNNGKKLLMNALMGYPTSGDSGIVRIAYVGFGQSGASGKYTSAVENNDTGLTDNIIKGGNNLPGANPELSVSNGKVSYGAKILGKYILKDDISFKTTDNENAYPYLQISFVLSADDIAEDKQLSEIALFLLAENTSNDSYAFPTANEEAAQFAVDDTVAEVMFSKVDIGSGLTLTDNATYNISYYIYF